MTKKKGGYSEPSDFFPKELRKKFEIGEFAEKKKSAPKKKRCK